MTEKQLEITTATNLDIPILKILVEEYWREIEEKYRPEDQKQITLANLQATLEYGYTYFQKGCSLSDDDIIYLASVDNTVVGFVSLAYIEEEKEVVIYDFMIKNKFQGQGYGSQLMGYIMEIVNKLGVDQIVLSVDDVNIVAKKLYQKFGFEFHGVDMLDWNDKKRNIVLQTVSERWRASLIKEKILTHKVD